MARLPLRLAALLTALTRILPLLLIVAVAIPIVLAALLPALPALLVLLIVLVHELFSLAESFPHGPTSNGRPAFRYVK